MYFNTEEIWILYGRKSDYGEYKGITLFSAMKVKNIMCEYVLLMKSHGLVLFFLMY